jgi:NAD(P)-dependent dehydrogenase (short-subunit alcohol dehydrogenase family)
MVMQTLKNRTCVFAGATGGDGVAAVEALLRGGMNVIMVTHQAAQAQELLDRMNELGLPGCCEVIGAGEKRSCGEPGGYICIYTEKIRFRRCGYFQYGIAW